LSVFSSVFLPMNTPAPVFDRLISVSTKPGQVQTLAWYVVDGITSAIRFRNLPDEPVKPKKPTWWDKLKA
jgi:hypothetical protein